MSTNVQTAADQGRFKNTIILKIFFSSFEIKQFMHNRYNVLFALPGFVIKHVTPREELTVM